MYLQEMVCAIGGELSVSLLLAHSVCHGLVTFLRQKLREEARLSYVGCERAGLLSAARNDNLRSTQATDLVLLELLARQKGV